MIPNAFTRPITAWTTIFVLVLHGVTIWAVASMKSPERPQINTSEPTVIELELVTSTPALPTAKPQSASQPNPQLKKKSAETIKLAAPVPDLVKPLEPVQPSRPESKGEQSDPIKEEPKLEKEAKLEKETKVTVLEPDKAIKEPEEMTEEQNLVALVQAMTGEFDSEPVNIMEQELITKESKKTVQAMFEKDIDLDAIIRAVTAKYNRDQARQRQEAKKRDEQDRQQAQDSRSDKKQKQANVSNQPVKFATEQASWLLEHEPNTSLPLPVWRETTARSGDVFTVLLELHVDKNGYVTEVRLLQSSGNQIIDAVATVQVRAGQLNPFKQDGIPVDGIVPMSLRYERP